MANAAPETVEVICTLNDQEFQDRRAWVRKHISPHVLTTDKIATGLKLTFPDTPDIRKLAEEFAELERQCCGGFLDFTVQVNAIAQQIDLLITGPDDAQPMLLNLKQRIDAKQFP